MKIYLSVQKKIDSNFLELQVSESITAQEVLQLPEVKKLFNQDINSLRVGVNGEELDGKYKAAPANHRMSHGERLEIYRSLNQDPKQRRLNKAKAAKKR
jgi:putative ubiquitin-RnfH superfamily antitoxin RatB of RatAB toxin-antitoxin module